MIVFYRKDYVSDFPKVNLYNADSENYIKSLGDNEYDLAIIDPPYGIREDGHRENNRSKLAKSKKYHNAVWRQKRPSKQFFKHLKRISRNQIIFGVNHLCDLFDARSPSRIVWDKENGKNNFADCEIAYTSFDSAVRKFSYRWSGMLQGNMKNKEIRIHPTQKPVALYKWILKNYAKKGDKIIDTHCGSGSLVIACLDLGFSIDAFDKDPVYYNDMVERIKRYQSQLKIGV